MTNKNKKKRDEKPEYVPPTYKAFLESEKDKWMEALIKKYPKHPKPLLEMCIQVYEKETYGTDEEKERVKYLYQSLKENPDLSYFGSHGFEEEIQENKGFKIEYVNK